MIQDVIRIAKSKVADMYEKMKEDSWDLEPEVVKELQRRIEILNTPINKVMK